MSFWIDFLRGLWDGLVSLGKTIWTKVLNWTTNIVSWFRDPNRLNQLKKNSNIAATIKEHLANGGYRTVNCLYDKSTEEVVDIEQHIQGIESEKMDNRTRQEFGDKDMIVLQ